MTFVKDHKLFSLLTLLIFIWSGISPAERFTWYLEVCPVPIVFIFMALTYEKFPLQKIYILWIFLHFAVLMVGGKYTYAEVPLFNFIQEYFGHDRNNYDKIGHFMQGFVPAMILREYFIREKLINNRKWQFTIVVCCCLAFSAFYELLEWWVAIFSEDGSDAFLGTQGYIWDTQSDMFLAMIGSLLAQLIFKVPRNTRSSK